MNVPEKYRLIKHPVLGSDSSYGNNGFFIIPHGHIKHYFYNCMVSDGEGWEHVSVTLSSSKMKVNRCPNWGEMCWIKQYFWNQTETVMQLHPPEDQYVNNHKYCLHLWKPTNQEIPLPSSLLVGIKDLEF